VDRHKICQ